MMSKEPTYAESVKIGWTILWRTVGSFLTLLFGINILMLWAMPELTKTEPSIWMAIMPLGAAALLCLFAIMPSIVRSMLRIRYDRFHLQLIRESDSSETSHEEWRMMSGIG